ncbi:DUF4352 domain-containing protein [Candidatus Soleaferrea massiliensis]|uniref:DUF4352 domain-containing protein n=1 Tax=Candidatus Soleaferrea massiliensis TaxID=1470354 RepID=UPI0012E09E33|nr:DUF4352 domain-containing protein [Candidatus Soleaferrea massiliensis]
MKRMLLLLLSVSMTLVFSACASSGRSGQDQDLSDSDISMSGDVSASSGSSEADESISGTQSAESGSTGGTASGKTPSDNSAGTASEKKQNDFDKTFTFDNIEITLSSALQWSKIDNKFAEENGAEVVKIPATIRNKSDKPHSFNMFNYTAYGSKGTILNIISGYFDDDIGELGEMAADAEQHGYLYLLYDGDGDYTLVFDDQKNRMEIVLPIKRDQKTGSVPTD